MAFVIGKSCLRVGLSHNSFSYAVPFRDALVAVGLEPVDLVWWGQKHDLTTLDGMLFAGGVDIDPARYNQDSLPTTQEPDKKRDEIELSMMQECWDLDIPVLAICRGMQLMNVLRGGTLHQHISNHLLPHELNAHPILIKENTMLRSIARRTLRDTLASSIKHRHSPSPIFVNSRHHQAIDRLGSDLIVSATSEDGIIEALESSSHRFCIGVQWHPENRIKMAALDLHLFTTFAHHVRAHHAQRHSSIDHTPSVHSRL